MLAAPKKNKKEMGTDIVNKGHYNSKSFSQIAIKCGTKTDTLKIILDGQNNRIKEAIKFNEDKTRTSLQKCIFGIAEIYTTAQLTENENGQTKLTDTAKLVLSECIKLTIDKFNTLSIPEILEAFRSAASGKIEANLNAYYGKFTVTMYCDVLKAYIKLRNKIRANYNKNISLIEARKDDKNKEQKNNQVHEEIKKAFWQFVEMGKEGIEITLEEIPSFWGRIIAKQGLINASPEEKLTIYKQSEMYLINSLKSASIDETKTPSERKTIKTELLKILQNKAIPNKETNSFIKEKIDPIYSKKIVLYSIKKHVEENRNYKRTD